MEQNKTIFSYIGQLFATYGVIVTIFIVFTCIIGDNAKNISTLYSLGNLGLSLATLVQLLALAGVITLAQVAFLTDCWIKSMNMIIRTVMFFVTICVGIVIFAVVFMWFPINNITAWISFAISFTVCTVISTFISKLKENAENQKMEQALAKIKRQD